MNTAATSINSDIMDRFWHDDLAAADPEIAEAISSELKRQQNKIELIASENIASKAVLEVAGCHGFVAGRSGSAAVMAAVGGAA